MSDVIIIIVERMTCFDPFSVGYTQSLNRRFYHFNKDVIPVGFQVPFRGSPKRSIAIKRSEV